MDAAADAPRSRTPDPVPSASLPAVYLWLMVWSLSPRASLLAVSILQLSKQTVFIIMVS